VPFEFLGDYFGLAANENLLFGIWTDRRHQTSIGVGGGKIDRRAYESNVFGARINSGQ
jgi:hypothetical protein